MKERPTVRVFSARRDIEETFPIMSQLRPHLTLEAYAVAVERMQTEGFLLAGVSDGNEVVAVAGYRFGESLAHGRYCYVDDLVTVPAARSHGYGKANSEEFPRRRGGGGGLTRRGRII